MVQVEVSDADAIDVVREVDKLLRCALEEVKVWELLGTHHVNAAVEHDSTASDLDNNAAASHVLACA